MGLKDTRDRGSRLPTYSESTSSSTRRAPPEVAICRARSTNQARRAVLTPRNDCVATPRHARQLRCFTTERAATAATVSLRGGPSRPVGNGYRTPSRLMRTRSSVGSGDAAWGSRPRFTDRGLAGGDRSKRVSAGLVHRQPPIEGRQLKRAARRPHRTGNRELTSGVV